MAESDEGANRGRDDEHSMKMAVALAILRLKALKQKPPPPPPPHSHSDSDALRWKQKAKERKLEIFRLREDLKQAEDSSKCDLFPPNASCKCYFFDHLGKLSPKPLSDGSDLRFNDVLRRRFLRQVRFKERRRKTGDSGRKRQFSDLSNGDEWEQLSASVDFLVELCDTVSPLQVEEPSFMNWAHQAVDFILGSLKNLISTAKNLEFIEGTVGSLVTRLVKRMCSPLQEKDSNFGNTDVQIYVQHLIRKLGSEAYIGQRAILSVSQRISVLAESFLFTDPFDVLFPRMHQCMFTMIQLIEFLVSDYLLTWSKDEDFDDVLYEEWVSSILHARKAMEILENRNGLYVLYMDRVTGELAKQVSQNVSLQKIKPEILSSLRH